MSYFHIRQVSPQQVSYSIGRIKTSFLFLSVPRTYPNLEASGGIWTNLRQLGMEWDGQDKIGIQMKPIKSLQERESF